MIACTSVLQGVSDSAAMARANPRWVADSEVAACMLCNAAFGMMRWRQHCRHCGWVVCGDCSGHKLKLVRTTMPGQPKPNGSGEQKVCDSCFTNIPLDKKKAEREELERKKAERELERKNAPAMQAKYPELKECAALARLGLTAADTVRACYIFIRFVMYGRVYGSMFTNSLELYSLMMCSPKFTCIFCT